MSKAKTLFEKVWNDHVVVRETDGAPAVLYIDLHLIHEVTSPQAFQVLKERGLPVRQPARTLATADHSTPTLAEEIYGSFLTAQTPPAKQVRMLRENCTNHGIELHGIHSDQRGIVHVIGPELGATQPGKTIVCGDSHTSTHGALGALAFGIGTTEVGHVLATQCLLQRRPKTLAIEVDGTLGEGVSAKDLILAIIGKIGVAGGVNHVIEYRGSGIQSLSMEQRMTVCNMSIEAGARAGMIAPDDTTFEYLSGRPMVPKGKQWDDALFYWQSLPSDPGADYDQVVQLSASDLAPQVTFGTNPGMVIPIDGEIPVGAGDPVLTQALDYMGLEGGEPLLGKPINVAFVGSCTNSRISDLRDAAKVLQGRKVADGVTMLVVPGSQQVKQQAEQEGLDKVFVEAGAQWRESGCSMCLGMNGDTVARGHYSVSTSNRNFEGRQGPGARTLLASPLTAAASAVAGQLTDPRVFLEA
ncbi:MAG: 3-isopropylmalate dehydratase large subunit [Pseudomonadota bacterium]